jgi:hypothetical protein
VVGGQAAIVETVKNKKEEEEEVARLRELERVGI